MAGSKTANKNAGVRGSPRERFLSGTDEKVVRVLNVENGKRRFVWAVKNGNDFKVVRTEDTELR